MSASICAAEPQTVVIRRVGAPSRDLTLRHWQHRSSHAGGVVVGASLGGSCDKTRRSTHSQVSPAHTRKCHRPLHLHSPCALAAPRVQVESDAAHFAPDMVGGVRPSSGGGVPLNSSTRRHSSTAFWKSWNISGRRGFCLQNQRSSSVESGIQARLPNGRVGGQPQNVDHGYSWEAVGRSVRARPCLACATPEPAAADMGCGSSKDKMAIKEPAPNKVSPPAVTQPGEMFVSPSRGPVSDRSRRASRAGHRRAVHTRRRGAGLRRSLTLPPAVRASQTP